MYHISMRTGSKKRMTIKRKRKEKNEKNRGAELLSEACNNGIIGTYS